MINIARAKLDDEEKAVGSGLLWRTGLVVLLGIMIAYALLITVPYYGSGIHLMSQGEIYQANNTRNLADWYFLLDNEGFIRESAGYFSAVATFVLYFYSIPLFLILSFASVSKWKVLYTRDRAFAVVVTLLYLTLFTIHIASHNGVVAWLFD